jgi:SAM-dependent methyltransferase
MVLESPESRALGLPMTHSLSVSMSGNEPRQHIQVDVDDGERRRLFEAVQQVWRGLGEARPHWSVVSDESFLPENIEGSIGEFYESGERAVATLLRTLARNAIDIGTLARCMDFGCGLGRLTLALAPHFRKVHGVDFSESHLALAREALQRRGGANVELHRLGSIEEVSRLPQVDLIFSLIVLQHNPPPVMRELLEGLLQRLDTGGVAVIQLPTYLAGYRFDAREYLAADGHQMEMHALPQREVFASARKAGVEVLEILEDQWTGYGVGSQSNTFVLRRGA